MRSRDTKDRCPETTPSCYGHRSSAERGPLSCDLPHNHGAVDMHHDPTRGTWRHPAIPYGTGRKPKRGAVQ